jgi:hypothetical protein
VLCDKLVHGVSALLGLSGCGKPISYENGNVIIVLVAAMPRCVSVPLW